MRIQIKRDISDNWNSNNPILKSGEFGYDITNNIVKIGDGVTTWKNLSCCNYDDFINKAKSYTDSVIENLIGEAPSTLDTIYEIAQAIQNNQSIIESLNQSIANKVDKVSGKGLSTNDFSNDMKNKLSTAYDHSQKTSGNPHDVTKIDVGLANVDNTSDANKPVSTAQATAIADAKKAGTDAQSSVDTLSKEVKKRTDINYFAPLRANYLENGLMILFNKSTWGYKVGSGTSTAEGEYYLGELQSAYTSGKWFVGMPPELAEFGDYINIRIKSSSEIIATDIGNGCAIPDNASGNLGVYLYIAEGITITEQFFIKPMCCDDRSLTYNDYIRPTGGQGSLINDLAYLSNNYALYKRDTVEPLKATVSNNTNAISDLSTDMKRIFKHKNLIGNTLDYYPVFIKSGSTITCSTYDGSVSSVTEAVIEFYDKNKTKLDAYSSILPGNSSRTFTLTCDDVYYVKWKILPTIPIQMEFGDRATSYEEYIDDYNFNAIVDINSSMSDYGLNNVFDGKIYENFYYRGSDGALIGGSTNGCFCNVNKINAKQNDLITLTYSNEWSDMGFGMYKSDGTYLGNTYEFIQLESNLAIIRNPYDSDCIIFNIVPKDGKTVGKVNVYINNQIDVLENSKAPINHTHNYVPSSGSSDSAARLHGFSSRPTSISWGTLSGSDYKYVTVLDTPDSGSIAFADKLNQTSMQIDGYFYQNEGAYMCLDTNNYKTYCTPANIGAANSSHTHTTASWTGKSDNRDYQMAFSLDSQYNFDGDSKFQYNPSSKTLKVKNIKATGDTTVSGDIAVNGKFKSDVYLNSPYKIKTSVSSAYGTYTRNLIWYDQSSSVMYKSYSDEITDTIGIHIGDGGGSILIDAGHYIYLKGYRVSTSDEYAFSDEKIKMFTNDIKLDKEKIIKLFDLINIKTYTRRDEIDICSNVKIGISAQELENSMIQVGLDNAKYNIIDNHYNFMMNRGNDEEDAKYYPKFMTVNYDALYTLSLIKMRDMEEKHTLRLTELENRVTALENK